MRRIIGLLILIIVTPLPLLAQTINTIDRGWYDDSGTHNASNDNYFTGTHHYYPDIDLRSFFAFDLTELNGEVTSAELQLYNIPDGYEGPNQAEILKLFDVTTSITSLISGGSNLVQYYNDLGNGALYGERSVGYADNDSFVSITLNQSALDDLSDRLGGMFAIGAILDNNLNGSKVFGGTYTGNPADGNTRLELSIAPVPLPTAFWLFGSGLLGLIGMTRHKKLQKTGSEHSFS